MKTQASKNPRFGHTLASRAGGFTLIELMVVIAVVGVLLALAAPSMQEMIQVRRLKAINAQLVTDFQFARSETVARRAYGRITFGVDPALPQTCYTIYTAPNSLKRCDCNLGAGAACSGVPNAIEIKTVIVPRSSSTYFKVLPIRGVSDAADKAFHIGFEPAMGSLVTFPRDTDPEPVDGFSIDTKIDDPRTLRTILARSGRPSVCAPTGSKMDVPACP